jgi:CheY-like chemotaxis protein
MQITAMERPTPSSESIGSATPRRPVALVVEPDARAAEMAQGMLDLLGYDAVVAASGSAALEAIGDRSPVFVLLSLDLVDLDAAEVLRIVRRFPVGARLVVGGHQRGARRGERRAGRRATPGREALPLPSVHRPAPA